MKTLLFSLAAFFPLAAAANASPIVISSDAVRAEHVSPADLRLDSLAGQRALYGRIRAAAGDVCSRDGERDVDALVSAQLCYRAAVADGVAQAQRLVASPVAAASAIVLGQ
jgi:UrcA family protein